MLFCYQMAGGGGGGGLGGGHYGGQAEEEGQMQPEEGVERPQMVMYSTHSCTHKIFTFHNEVISLSNTFKW